MFTVWSEEHLTRTSSIKNKRKPFLPSDDSSARDSSRHILTSEIDCERWRDKIGLGVCNALRGCGINGCNPAVNRLQFRQTVDFTDAISKGGKKDIKAGVALGEANQMAFLKWLCALTKEYIELLVSHATLIGLTEFDIQSLRNV